LFITSDGKLGLGTSSPGAAFHIADAVPVIRLTDTDSGNPDHLLSGSGGNFLISVDANNEVADSTFRVSVDGGEKFRIDSSGRLGLGTSAPNCQLTNTGTTSLGTNNWPTTTIARSGGRALVGSDGILVIWNETAGAGNAADFRLGAATGAGASTIGYARLKGGTENGTNYASFFSVETTNTVGSPSTALYIDSSKRVGIGTTSPAASLDAVAESTNGFGVRIRGRSSDGFGALQFTSNDGSSQQASIGVASSTLVISTASSERARIDSSGRLLVGTSSARSNFNTGSDSAALQIEGTGTASSTLSCVRNSNDAGTSAIVLGHSRGSTVNENTVLQNGDPVGAIIFEGADGTNFVRSARIDCVVDGTPGANDMPGRLVFSTTADGASSPTERMRIRNTGRLDYLTTNFVGAKICTTLAASLDNYLILGESTRSSLAADDGTTRFIVYSNGNVQNSNNSYGSISDIKLKENIVNASSQWNDLKALQVRNYNFKEETGQQTHTQIGLIAQEVELVSPGLVSESPDRDEDGNETGEVTKSVNYSVLYMKAVKALQEAMERIEQLETSNADLLARVTVLEAV
jgi:hypothetical protein